ncbi:hypothetical protein [Sphingomonas sp. BE137]|uniref:hypothetical protein n=1 Tax=Sphingomonas sp. BE137 TaxID=2817844 RepID=UPI001AE41805|nr:hypothetical protein [Sphingomonas sp. BE137]MDR6847165.1 hypothetical protein [Sphingomonas sp. BE137]
MTIPRKASLYSILRVAFRHCHSDMPDQSPANPQKSAVFTHATDPAEIGPASDAPAARARVPIQKVSPRRPSVTLWIGLPGDDGTEGRISAPYFIRARTTEPTQNRLTPQERLISPVFLI